MLSMPARMQELRSNKTLQNKADTAEVLFEAYRSFISGSNGDPSLRSSLRYISSTPNSYEIPIQAVGTIIQDYASDRKFRVLGFGAGLPPDGRVSRDFFVNMITDYPCCKGINGVLEAYHSCIRKVQLYGPTNFCPVINLVARFASVYRDGAHHFVLLIITDGVITDMQKTVERFFLVVGLILDARRMRNNRAEEAVRALERVSFPRRR
ncbi:hypothetical protein J437_LFUL002622 [Ladona fulva]|uniref:Copine C-terminal domain-containing protein n=1 Tax=Ladona fulva TaxID=123851 RepID=A0A8K0JWW4_LADFU|nr:hypothetical protein J437_LFUL002622 [Ladona fulva]